MSNGIELQKNNMIKTRNIIINRQNDDKFAVFVESELFYLDNKFPNISEKIMTKFIQDKWDRYIVNPGRLEYDDGTYYVGGIENNERDGYGIWFDDENCKIYEGQWHKDSIDGLGTTYDTNGTVIYQGEWKNNRRDGYGVSYDETEKVSHCGKWENGHKCNN